MTSFGASCEPPQRTSNSCARPLFKCNVLPPSSTMSIAAGTQQDMGGIAFVILSAVEQGHDGRLTDKSAGKVRSATVARSPGPAQPFEVVQSCASAL